MNKLVFFAVCLAVATAADYRRPVPVKKPIEKKKPVEVIEEPIVVEPIVEEVEPEVIGLPSFIRSEEELQQNKNARYEFSADIEDEIRGLTNHRHEVRDGLKVVGQYTYSDGFFRRTTYYEADENGFRVTKQEEEPLAGPVEHLSGGEAAISSNAHGAETAYRIKSILHDDDKYLFEEIL